MRDDTKNDCKGYRDSIKEASKTLILFQMEEDISPTSLNVTAESNSKFKLVVNAYGCFESEMKTLKVIKLRNV